jgi:hypothetical protein
MKTNNEKNNDQIFEITLIEKYRFLFEECHNIFNVEEIILCKDDDEIEYYLELFKLEIQNININKGSFSVKVNDKFLIIKEIFKTNLKEFCQKFLLKIRNITKIDSNKDYDITSEDFLKLFLFLNFILFFSPEFYTIYNMKKEILKKISFREKEKLLKDYIISDFKFVNFINSLNRKCSISWEYRLYLVQKFPHFLQDGTNEKFLILKNLKVYLEIFFIPIEKVRKILINDLESIDSINEKEKRNYHLWKYIVHIFNLYSDNPIDSLFILSFCIYNFLKDTLDYSAYSAVTNYYKKLKPIIIDKSGYNLKVYVGDLINTFPEKMNDYVFNFLSSI